MDTQSADSHENQEVDFIVPITSFFEKDDVKSTKTIIKSVDVLDCENDDEDVASVYTSNTMETAVVNDTRNNAEFGDSSDEDEIMDEEESKDIVIVPNLKIYRKLISIFPNEDKEYIIKICNNPPCDEPIISDDFLLNALVSHLIMREEVKPFVEKDYELQEQQYFECTAFDAKENIIQAQVKILLDIFEDADPAFLRQYLIDNFENEEAIDNFIQIYKVAKNYPKKPTNNEHLRKVSQIRHSVTNLNVKKFLQIFPQPVDYFEDKDRKCTKDPGGLKFLSIYFSNVGDRVSAQYESFNYNLTLTVQYLEDRFGKRTASDLDKCLESIPLDNILLKEITYIVNKDTIIDYLQHKREKRNKEFKKLKVTNKLLKCLHCLNDEMMPKDAEKCPNQHVFCKPCIAKRAEAALEEGKFTIQCFLDECKKEFPPIALQNAMGPIEFNNFVQKYQRDQVEASGIDGLNFCLNCNFAMILPLNEKTFQCMNLRCLQKSGL